MGMVTSRHCITVNVRSVSILWASRYQATRECPMRLHKNDAVTISTPSNIYSRCNRKKKERQINARMNDLQNAYIDLFLNCYMNTSKETLCRVAPISCDRYEARVNSWHA